MFTLRDYQLEAVDHTFEYLEEMKGNPCICLATGAGKSLVLAELIRRIPKDKGILLISHRAKILTQNIAKIESLLPLEPIGIYSASLREKRIRRVTVAQVQSIYRQVEKLDYEFHYILVDENHLVSSKDEGMYQKIIKRYPKARVIGLTATPKRLDSGSIVGEGKTFTHFSYMSDIRQLIDDGYLTPLIGKVGVEQADLSEVKLQGQEYILSQAMQAINKDFLTRSATEECIKYGKDRKHWIVFCSGIEHAENVSREFSKRGITNRVITGDTIEMERNLYFNEFESGQVTALINVDVLTTGFDAPCIDMIVMLRATKSVSLYSQILGRGMRLYPGKKDCIASGQRVLTDVGLVSIENVTKDMKLWDGENWVSHQGIINKGKQRVITYAGLTATKDHEVWTKEGWKTFGLCARSQIAISVTGDAGQNLKLSNGHFRNSIEKGETSIPDDSVQYVREGGSESIADYKEKFSWMPEVWEKTPLRKAFSRSTKMVASKMYFCKTKMLKPKGFKIQRLWKPRDPLQFCFPQSYGSLVDGEHKLQEGTSDRQDRQRWSLRAWESKNGFPKHQSMQHEGSTRYGIDAQIQDDASTNSICGQYLNKFTRLKRILLRSSRREVLQPSFVETEREVWDILNAGSNHRFTVEGLLVSNCLVLDFAHNLEEHGPIDEINYKASKQREKGERQEGEFKIPAKICEKCLTLNKTAARECSECQFPFPERIVTHSAVASSASPLSMKGTAPAQYPITDINFVATKSKNTGKPMLVVNYYSDILRFSEFLFFDHEGFARDKSVAWWKKHTISQSVGLPIPENTEEAEVRIAREMFMPEEIWAKKDKDGYDKVLSVKLTTEVVRKWKDEKLRKMEEDIPF